MHEHDDDELFDPDEDDTYKSFKLTRNEALYLDDTCTLMVDPHPHDARGDIHGASPMGMRPPIFSAGVMVPYDLIEKIGYAVLYTTDEGNQGEDAEIQVSMTDLLVLREVAQSFIKIGDEPVGFNLKRKVAKALHQEFYENQKTNQVADKILQQVEMEFSEHIKGS